MEFFEKNNVFKKGATNGSLRKALLDGFFSVENLIKGEAFKVINKYAYNEMA